MALNEMLKNFRKSKNYSLRELSEASNVSHSYIYRLEDGKVKHPDKEKLLAIAFTLDPTNKDDTYLKMLKSASLDCSNAENELNEYTQKQLDKISDYKEITNEVINGMKTFNNYMRVVKGQKGQKAKEIIELDEPYLDIRWLLTQNKYSIYYGEDPIKNAVGSEFLGNVFIITDDEKHRMLNELDSLKIHFEKEREYELYELEKNHEIRKIKKQYDEYQLIFDLLNNRINDKNELISKLAVINKEREIFNVEEYHEEIEKAVEQQDALKLQRLVRMTTINELKQYLSEQN
ncbi:helix-turn-helix domain-containing protein [Staphylococcus cohnii]|uniref:helix-turn-helix domain-containing protein n=1 Tax=Staphylococcus cohnii TaxID=29382 RepID=UPI001600841B|nr:helix-turn-helix domain-containing protein [Staphylococcus cohnii]MBB2508481.1 hypothetical protein [Staphylococcus cohnii subsp. barensis]